jgi:hypothetical protein
MPSEDQRFVVRLGGISVSFAGGLCYGVQTEDVYERIKNDIPVFRFDWFSQSRTLQELQRCNMLLTMIEKETELEVQEEAAKKQPKGKVILQLSLLRTRR